MLLLPLLMAVDAAKPVVPLLSSPDLGKAEGKCRPDESGPAFLVDVVGLKDRVGKLKLEVYPANDADFLADDNLLISQGKTFRRVEEVLPKADNVQLCVRVPGPGPYTVTVLHDRDGNRKFGWTIDGIGFASNPKLGWSKPKAAAARVVAGNGPTRISIVMNYRSGLGVAPLR